jgi:predicted small lipoprotein YifL
MLRIVALLLVVLVLSACGQKGPLYRKGEDGSHATGPAGYSYVVKP